MDMTHYMTAYDNLREYKIKVCCEKLANVDLEYVCKQSGKWMAGGEGQVYYEMFFCPFCGSKLE